MPNHDSITQQPGQPEEVQLLPVVVTTQPGHPVDAAPGSVWMPLPPTIQDVPTGLEYLTYLEMIQIYQLKDIIEVLTTFDTKNKYVLKNVNGEQCYYAFEESDCCDRACCGATRAFEMHVVDNFKNEVLTIYRDCNCSGNGCSGCLAGFIACQQLCTIETPSMGLLGTIQQKFGCMTSNFDVLDRDGRVVFEIDGPDCCELMCCGDKDFLIRTANTDNVIGTITKKWGGILREAFTVADTFCVTFPLDLDVKMKGVLLGATFLIDFMHFEKQN